MTDLERTARVAEIQTHLRNKPFLKLEFLAMVSKLFRDHQVDLSPDVLTHVTLTLDRSAVTQQGGGINPPPVPVGGPPPVPVGGPPPVPVGGS